MSSARTHMITGFIVVLILAGVFWASEVRAPVAESLPISPLSPLQVVSLRPIPVTVAPAPVAFTPEATVEPTYTPVVSIAPVLFAADPINPPVPTALPTPDVTAIPTITPPYIEGLAP